MDDRPDPPLPEQKATRFPKIAIGAVIIIGLVLLVLAFLYPWPART